MLYLIVVLILAAVLLGLWWGRRSVSKLQSTVPLDETSKISLLIPFRSDNAERQENFQWLLEYYRANLPEAEIVIGHDDHMPFCKTAAVNNAFAKSTGDVVVILDADAYLSTDVIRCCAMEIRAARDEGRKLWFMPYRRFYRLTESYTRKLLKANPRLPFQAPFDPPDNMVEHPETASSGHWWGALVQILPREAWIGMDERFQGWGGEDVSHMYMMDTLYIPHKTTNNPVYHMWHPTFQGAWKYTRMWEGQATPEANEALARGYKAARGDRARMSSVASVKEVV